MFLLLLLNLTSPRPDKKLESVVAPTRREKDKPYYAHMFPYMMMTQPSISELNRWGFLLSIPTPILKNKPHTKI